MKMRVMFLFSKAYLDYLITSPRHFKSDEKLQSVNKISQLIKISSLTNRPIIENRPIIGEKVEICRSAKRHFRYLFFISSSLIYIGHEKKL